MERVSWAVGGTGGRRSERRMSRNVLVARSCARHMAPQAKIRPLPPGMETTRAVYPVGRGMARSVVGASARRQQEPCSAQGVGPCARTSSPSLKNTVSSRCEGSCIISLPFKTGRAVAAFSCVFPLHTLNICRQYICGAIFSLLDIHHFPCPSTLHLSLFRLPTHT